MMLQYFGIKLSKQASYWSKTVFFPVKNHNKFSTQNIYRNIITKDIFFKTKYCGLLNPNTIKVGYVDSRLGGNNLAPTSTFYFITQLELNTPPQSFYENIVN